MRKLKDNKIRPFCSTKKKAKIRPTKIAIVGGKKNKQIKQKIKKKKKKRTILSKDPTKVVRKRKQTKSKNQIKDQNKSKSSQGNCLQ